MAARPAGGARRFDLLPDRKGAVWDLLLYVPTVVALASVGATLWFEDNRALAYLLCFLASFFLLVGANRILKTRLMLLPTAPRGFELDGEALGVLLRNASRVELVKQLKVYRDVAGRSFGVSGLDRQGRRLTFVFHRGQFAGADDFRLAQDALQKAAKG